MSFEPESRTGKNPFSFIYKSGQVPFPEEWTVTVSYNEANRYSTPWEVMATETATGAKIGSSDSGLYPDPARPRQHKTLGRARDDAEDLFATCVSAMWAEPWPFRPKVKGRPYKYRPDPV